MNVNDRGIIYFSMGSRPWAVLAVSIMTLREWWDGPVQIMVGDEKLSEPLRQIILAGECNFTPPRSIAPYTGRNAAYAIKPSLPELSPYYYTLQLDADTIIVGPLDDEVWPQHERETVLTPFAHWVTTGGIISNRIGWWKKAEPERAAHWLANTAPAVNTGVLSYGPEAVLARKTWRETTAKNPQVFISDEIAMQLVMYEDPDMRLIDDRYNLSPLYGVRKDDPRIWHCHGKKHVRRARGMRVWWPHYLRAMECNFAGIRDWTPAGDAKLREFMEANPDAMDTDIETLAGRLKE